MRLFFLPSQHRSFDGRIRAGSGYEYVVVPCIDMHLLGRKPSHEQNISEAVFGFGPAENAVISGTIEFPPFVRSTTSIRATYRYVYVGNYKIASNCVEEVFRESAPFPFLSQVTFLVEILHDWGKAGAVRAVEEKGLADKPDLSEIERKMGDVYTRYEFEAGVYKVPCCRLEFQRFDDHLKATLDSTPRRVRGLSSAS